MPLGFFRIDTSYSEGDPRHGVRDYAPHVWTSRTPILTRLLDWWHSLEEEPVNQADQEEES